MKNKDKPALERAADAINDVVEDLTLKAAGVAEPDVENVAGKTNEQVYLPEISEAGHLPSHIDPRSANRVAREQKGYIEQIVANAASASSKVANQKNKSIRRLSRKTQGRAK